MSGSFDETEVLKEFVREQTMRIERVAQRMHEDSLRAQREHGVMIDRLNDLSDESRAQRGALLALIDEMRGGGAAPAT